MVEAVDLVRAGEAPVVSQQELFDKDPGVLRAMVQVWAGAMRRNHGHLELTAPESASGHEVFLDRETVYEAWDMACPEGSSPPDEVLDAIVTIGTYEGWCRAQDAEIDWLQPERDVYNLIRGANPQPGAWTRSGGKKLQIYDSRPSGREDPLFTDDDTWSAEEKRDKAGYRPGCIHSVHDESFTIWTGEDGWIEVLRVRPEGGAKMGAGEFAAAAGLKAGDSLGLAGAGE